jgi:hypothetical protein
MAVSDSMVQRDVCIEEDRIIEKHCGKCGLEKIRSGERLSVEHRWVKNVFANQNGQIWITFGGDRVAVE